MIKIKVEAKARSCACVVSSPKGGVIEKLVSDTFLNTAFTEVNFLRQPRRTMSQLHVDAIHWPQCGQCNRNIVASTSLIISLVHQAF